MIVGVLAGSWRVVVNGFFFTTVLLLSVGVVSYAVFARDARIARANLKQ